jgi:hypothetical protein
MWRIEDTRKHAYVTRHDQRMGMGAQWLVRPK